MVVAHYGAICDASYPTFFLDLLGPRPQRPTNDDGEAIHILSQEAANAVGLLDRGLLKPGYKADVNVIDLDRLRLHAPEIKI